MAFGVDEGRIREEVGILGKEDWEMVKLLVWIFHPFLCFFRVYWI